jgi:hypothetical protein
MSFASRVDSSSAMDGPSIRRETGRNVRTLRGSKQCAPPARPRASRS